jgi:hypothetical protein
MAAGATIWCVTRSREFRRLWCVACAYGASLVRLFQLLIELGPRIPTYRNHCDFIFIRLNI